MAQGRALAVRNRGLINHVWWRTHLRQLSEPGLLIDFASFSEADEMVPFLTEALDLPAGGRLLEIGCGQGPYSIRLAQWGYRISAIEESGPMLAVAREEAGTHRVEIDFRHGDPRSLAERSAFDGALFLDFGTYADAHNAELLRTAAAALKPGGRLVFGTFNPYYWAREPRTEHRLIDGTDIIREFGFDFAAGSALSRVRCIRADGRRLDLPAARYRAYTPPELRSLAAGAGLADLRIHGEDSRGCPAPDQALDSLRTPFFHCVALRPVTGEGGEGI